MSQMNPIADNIRHVQHTIEQACHTAGRNPAEVTLIAVSKTKPTVDILSAIEAGIVHFGENRIEEAEQKIPMISATPSTPITWHMIGHIQSRKAKSVPPLFDVVHSVDTLKLATKLSETAYSIQKVLPIFLEINISGEESKEGLNAVDWANQSAVRTNLWHDIQAIAQLPSLHIRGLMTMAPYYAEAQATRPVFRSLAHLRQALQNDLGLALPDLSMGMTNDYPVAIEEGSTLVRVGRAIFGER